MNRNSEVGDTAVSCVVS